MFHPNNYLFENGKSLINVKLECEVEINRSPFDVIADPASLFAKNSNFEYLSLSLHGVNASYLPEFVSLSQLVLVLHGFNKWEFIIQCLNRSPNLKHLVLKRKWCYRQDELEWNFFNPPELPGCLVSHIRTISIKGFKGQRDEMKMAEFLLKNGKS
ncbi:putative FBD-associated F-box protein At5g56430 [Argentina anserina]|uniref:putative FBD-associated F-box protein At5g56430 n=1 Tax=Argentina anserina TaxID=57926 RepID=UPI0021762887|nr:putative FBD-associated F-box protein At5g56430 [Potentilla anserina]